MFSLSHVPHRLYNPYKNQEANLQQRSKLTSPNIDYKNTKNQERKWEHQLEKINNEFHERFTNF